MPSLPRIRRTRTREIAAVVPRPRREPAELTSAGLTWIHLDSPTLGITEQLAEHFGWHDLDVEDIMSKRQRPKVDDYADEGYLFVVLHFPVYDRAVQRLNAGELDLFIGPTTSSRSRPWNCSRSRGSSSAAKRTRRSVRISSRRARPAPL